MTNHWVDIKNADLVLIMGGNAAEAHPCGFKWVTEAKAHNDARLIVVDPRFTRSASVADVYAPIRPGTDIAFLGGVIRYLLENDRIQREYVTQYTDAAFIVREEFAFGDGIYSGYDAERRAYDRSSWEYEIGEDGYARTDPTLAHPRCVLNLLGAHYARYTPAMVERICGTPRERFLQICEMIASTATPTRAMTIMYALGWTQHSVGSQMIRCGAMLQLLLGNIGVSGGGMNALRGHSNIQGLTDLGLLSDLLPGYLAVPTEDEQRYGDYVAARTQRPLRPNQLSYWQYYPRFFVSLQKAWWGDAARAENDWAYDYLPKLDRLYDMLQTYELMHQGRFNGYLAQGFNPLAAAPSKAKMTEALSRLKYLVIMDPLATETSEFWRNFGEHNDVDSSAIETEVFRLPTSCFAEEEGALVNSGRWLQWHWKGAEPPGDARTDIEIMSGLFTRLRRLYETEGGAFPDPILNLTWSYANPERPSPEEIAREYNGRALADVTEVTEVTQVTDVAGAPDGTDAADVADAPDATDAADAAVGAAPPRIVRRAGEQLSGFGELRDDGTTACGCWIYAGAWTEAGNQMARRDNSDPTGIGQTLNWAWSWPANRRVLYNRASCDSQGRPFDPARTLVEWNGTRWTGADTPDFPLDAEPGDGMGPFIMNQEGVARLFARGNLAEGPFPEHYEPFETPLGYNPLHPDELRAVNNPAARVFDADRQAFGDAERFPHVATTYRLTEHFHFWTQHVRLNAIIQPEQFVEIGEGLARELGIAAGDRVHVESNRGRITAVAVVTKRIRTLDIDGRQVHTVGIPITWGFTGVAKPGFLANTLTPFVGDANVQTPEFKAFLVRVEKA